MSILLSVCSIIPAGREANSVDPDQTPRFAASDLGLHCLYNLVKPNTQCKFALLSCSLDNEAVAVTSGSVAYLLVILEVKSQ